MADNHRHAALPALSPSGLSPDGGAGGFYSVTPTNFSPSDDEGEAHFTIIDTIKHQGHKYDRHVAMEAQ